MQGDSNLMQGDSNLRPERGANSKVPCQDHRTNPWVFVRCQHHILHFCEDKYRKKKKCFPKMNGYFG